MSQANYMGLVCEVRGPTPVDPALPADAHAEYEEEATIQILEETIWALGFTPLRIGSPHDLLLWLNDTARPEVAAVLNIAEGLATRNREAWAPVLLEMADIPYLGSDALSLALSLDKMWTKELLRSYDIPVLPHCCMEISESIDLQSLPGAYPMFVKPRWEGSAKGLGSHSRVDNLSELQEAVKTIHEQYCQPALIEPFISGPEYTVAVVSNQPARALPVLQRALDPNSRIGLHIVGASEEEGITPGELTPQLEARLQALALRVYQALRCLDFARVDFRCDMEGQPYFLEINPLPTFAADSSFAILAELEGRPLVALLAEIFSAGLRRLGVSH